MNPKKYWAKKNRTKAERLKLKRECVNFLGGKCIDCGYSNHLAALDFDHVDPSTKEASMANLLANGTWEQLGIELKKCVVRCANCHRIKTHPDATDTF